jgi:tape measure domain-containing protein
MAFLGDLVVRIGANANPFTTALKKAQSMTQTFRNTLKDMQKTASVFAKVAASIKAVNNQMDRLIHVSRRALDATQNLARAEHLQAMNRLRELKMVQSMQERPQRRTSMLDIAGGIGIASTVQAGLGSIVDMAKATVNLAADAQTAQITFEVLTGDAARGAKLFKNIEKFAARTSFDLTSAADATKSLLAAGVGESDVLNTMQLLGDLAMGDANKLGFLSKAYTDVMNKGKLQGQEIRQFAENGVGLVGALAASMNKTNAEILQMSEAGKISFADMKKALESLAGPGGRFFGMMARINETFTGQWNSLVENIQTFGRDLGALVLPKLTAIVAETNKLLTAFNSLGDAKWKFASELIVASFDVAMETIKLHWADMLNDMLDQVSKINWSKLLNPFASVKISDLRPSTKPENLQEAQGRLDGLMGKLRGAGAANEGAAAGANVPKRFEGDTPAINNLNAVFAEWDRLSAANKEAWKSLSEVIERGASDAEIVAAGAAADAAQAALIEHANVTAPAASKAVGQERFTSGISSMFEKLKQSPLMGTIESLKMGAGGMIDRAKIHGGAMAGMFSNWFGSPDWEKNKQEKQEPQLAGAMAAGSQEAFSTIFAAMLQRGKDPNVTATEKQTRTLVKAMKENKPQAMMAMGLVGP